MPRLSPAGLSCGPASRGQRPDSNRIALGRVRQSGLTHQLLMVFVRWAYRNARPIKRLLNMKFAPACRERPPDVCNDPISIRIGNRFRVVMSSPYPNRLLEHRDSRSRSTANFRINFNRSAPFRISHAGSPQYSRREAVTALNQIRLRLRETLLHSSSYKVKHDIGNVFVVQQGWKFRLRPDTSPRPSPN
jgi:hypothetical protein